MILAISRWKVPAFFALLLTAIGLGFAFGLGGTQTVNVLMEGFGATMKWIAIIIILGAFIGEVLQETGGAVRIAQSIIKKVGLNKLPWAMGVTGYIVSIPVFVDVAYILFQPVTESLAVRSKKPVLYIGLSLAAGLTVAHTLIPPTPGPLAVASLLSLDLGRMLLINLFVAVFAMSGGILFVLYFVKNTWLEYDQKIKASTGSKEEELDIIQGNIVNDLLPIIVPILLIGLGGFLKVDNVLVQSIFEFVAIPLVAVFIGAGIAFVQIVTKGIKSKINYLVEQAIIKSALVIMITGAGGALGAVIKESGIQDQIVHVFIDFPFLGILLPFLVAALLTISTGSITVSLVSSASMIGPMVDQLPVSPEMVAALIGCGSFCVFHANSSFFWLLNRLHEVPPPILYKKYTVQSLVMGLSGLIGVFILLAMGL